MWSIYFFDRGKNQGHDLYVLLRLKMFQNDEIHTLFLLVCLVLYGMASNLVSLCFVTQEDNGFILKFLALPVCPHRGILWKK